MKTKREEKKEERESARDEHLEERLEKFFHRLKLNFHEKFEADSVSLLKESGSFKFEIKAKHSGEQGRGINVRDCAKIRGDLIKRTHTHTHTKWRTHLRERKKKTGGEKGKLLPRLECSLISRLN